MRSGRRIHAFRILSVATGLTAVLSAASPGAAQTPPASAPGTGATPASAGLVGVGVTAPHPTTTPPTFGFEEGIPPDQSGAREQDFYPTDRTRSIHQPAFLRGATVTNRTSRTSGVRWGLSGWTAPRVPFDFRESSGGAAFGLSIEWGVPLEPPPGEPKPTAPPPAPR